MSLLLSVCICLRMMLRERRDLAVENLAPASANGSLETIAEATQDQETRSTLLDLVGANLSWLARSTDHRQTRDSCRLASQRIQGLLDKAITPQGWWPSHFVSAGASLAPTDGDCQSAVGSTKNSWRIAQAGGLTSLSEVFRDC
jgi:hypothetical protein